MKIFLKNKIPILVIIISIICIFFGVIYLNSISNKEVTVLDDSNNENNFTYNDDGTVTLGSGMVANGFYDNTTNKIIDSGSLFQPVNGVIQGQVSFKQNISEKRNYLLIIMIDYKQKDFIVNDMPYTTFPFSLEGEDSIRINVEITNLSANAHEFSYLIIPEPDITELSISDSNEWNKLLMTSSLYGWRLLLNNSKKQIKPTEFDESYIKIDSQINYGIQLTKKYQEVTAMPSCSSMEDIELILSNTTDYDLEYVLVAFLDWKQTSIGVNDIPKFIKIPPQTNIYFKVTVPYVGKDTPYQIYAIPMPFSNDLKNIIPPFGTLRTIVTPNVEASIN